MHLLHLVTSGFIVAGYLVGYLQSCRLGFSCFLVTKYIFINNIQLILTFLHKEIIFLSYNFDHFEFEARCKIKAFLNLNWQICRYETWIWCIFLFGKKLTIVKDILTVCRKIVDLFEKLLYKIKRLKDTIMKIQ